MDKIVESNRILYTPSEFAKESLIYLQEIGQLKALKKHTSSREKLDSYLFFIVLDGNGLLNYENKKYKLSKGSCVFIDCNKKYSHTSDNWTIKWAHFYGNIIKKIYIEYFSENTVTSFKTKEIDKYTNLLNDMQTLSQINSAYKDMEIYNKLVNIVTFIKKDTLIETKEINQKYDIKEIKQYLDQNYLKKIDLDSLSNMFYINKYYLTRLFKKTYGKTINDYLITKRIEKAKYLLRFKNLNINDIANECNFNDSNYFSRIFKQIEKMTPKKYRETWK